MVFAHGAGGNHLSWWQQVPAFSDRYHCVTFDHRGFGQSLVPTDAPGRDAFVEDLRGLLDHLSIDKAFLVAQSMGGLTCLGFALAYPQRTLGLVLADTTGGIGEPEVVDVIRRRDYPDDLMLRALGPGFPDSEPAKAFLYTQINGMNPPREPEPNAFITGEGPKAPELAAMHVPTLLIAGDHDVLMPPPAMEAAQKLIPGSRLEMVAGGGHSVYFEQPGLFNRLVLEFFTGVLSGAEVVIAGD